MAKWQRIKYQPGTGLGENGLRITACKEHRELSKKAAAEGMVLLKNEKNLLPLAAGSRVALFGKAAFDYVKGGGGSGDVTVSYTINLYEGFRKLSDTVSIYEPLADFYRENVEKQYKEGKEPGLTTEPELPDELCLRAAAFTDTAIISICRFSGEGWDRKDDDFYLTAEETAMVDKVTSHFSKVAVVLNVGGMVDSSWFKEKDAVSSVLLAWQGGMEGGLAAAELLCGKANPSGRLSDTFAGSFDDYPSSYNFHESDSYVDYTEDIYVGYRYFETIPGADSKVNYPFGYGLSYTTFEWEERDVTREGKQIHVRVRVTNTGEMAGKEVMQLYGSAPMGKLGKPKRHLLAFRKTRLLQPGETQQLTLSFTIEDMASYDDLGKIHKAAYVLEKGTYAFFLGTSVRDVKKVSYEYRLAENEIVEQLVSRLVPSGLKKRMVSTGAYEPLPTFEGNNPDENELTPLPKEMVDGLVPSGHAVKDIYFWGQIYKKDVKPFTCVADGEMTVDEFLAQLTDKELADLLGGQPNTGVANTCGIGNLPEYGVPSVMTADGPAGLRILPDCGIFTTAWPCATALACTWNEDLVYQVGAAGAKEVKENNIGVWLTPAINIHRSPLCGRNFEYYSEDPLLTGRLAGAMVSGIQSQHISACVKHFALNNKETERKNSDSRVSERAAREIYLKAFEHIVKEAQPWCIMSSYNIINGHRASECKELLQGILRDEWGYEGMVTTDWWTYGEHYKEVKAGNDLKMACGFTERLLAAKEKGLLTRDEMEVCAKRILNLILKMD
jgi:beta-glucosidase